MIDTAQGPSEAPTFEDFITALFLRFTINNSKLAGTCVLITYFFCLKS